MQQGLGASAAADRAFAASPSSPQAVSPVPASIPLRGPVLIGCEYSATVRDEFRKRGFDAWSCDLRETEGDPRWHLRGCIRGAIESAHWALIILHVDCTKMAVCGNKHYGAGKDGHKERLDAVRWTLNTWKLACDHADCVALENPASVIFPELRRRGADVQYVQPWQHGHPEQKKTGLALHNLPRLTPTNDVYEHMMTLPRKERERVFFMSPGKDRGKERARFYTGIAAAMAEQWGRAAIADTHRNGGDSPQSEAPFMSGSGERSAIAQGQSR